MKSSLAQAPANVVRKNSASAATAAVRRPNGAASARARSKASRGSGVGSKDSGAWVNVPAWAAATTSPFCADHTSAFSASVAAVCANSRQQRTAGQQLKAERTSRLTPGRGSAGQAGSSCVTDVMAARAGATRLGGGAARRRSVARPRHAPGPAVQGSAGRVNMPCKHAARVRSVRVCSSHIFVPRTTYTHAWLVEIVRTGALASGPPGCPRPQPMCALRLRLVWLR